MHRFSDANYFEGQDFWRLTGFERDVYLYAQPQTRIADFEVQTPLDSSFKNGVFKLDVKVQNDEVKARSISVFVSTHRPRRTNRSPRGKSDKTRQEQFTIRLFCRNDKRRKSMDRRDSESIHTTYFDCR